MGSPQLFASKAFNKSGCSQGNSNKEHKICGRTVTRTLKIHEVSEGIGSRVRRCIGNKTVRCLPPFVICEHFRMDEKGRPPHPSRGAQKITYVLSGRVKIEYSPANSLELGPGDVTSLMVGKGVIRSVKASKNSDDEKQNESKSNKSGLGASRDKTGASASGIQIFMDVPEPFKRNDPSHLNLCHSDIITCEPNKGALVRILTGSAFGKKADQMLTATPSLILDITLEAGSKIEFPVQMDWNAFAYVIKGKAHIQGEKVQKHQYVEFMRTPGVSNADYDNSETQSNEQSEETREASVIISVDDDAKQHSRLLFCAAKPLCQPIYRQGPFVDVSMNWIHQAFDDYSERKNGFEADQWWNSHSQKPNSTIDDSISVPSTSECADKFSKSDKWGMSSPPYNPCENDSSQNDENCEGKHKGKASYPNSFPPGSINPTSHTTEFNGTENVEEQQEQKVPRKSESSKRRRPSESYESENSDTASASSPPLKKPNIE